MLRERLDSVLSRIEAARARSVLGQPVQLVAVSKKQPVELMREYLEACASCTVSPSVVFGENYVQEWEQKREALHAQSEEGVPPVHMIGNLQRNKAARAVALFDVIQSIHSIALLQAVGQAATKYGKQQDVFLQVNISKDPSKAGFSAEEVLDAFTSGRSMSSIAVRGLMTITREYESAEEARLDFRALRELRDSMDLALELSMGMSSDFEVAIEEGATLVRVGTALFGERL